MPRVIVPRQPEWITDGIHLLPYLQVARISKHSGNKVCGLDQDHGQVVRRIGAHNGCLVLLAVVEGHFDLACIGDDVIVGENVAVFIDDEAGALAFLRDQAVEEVEGHGARGDVHHRWNILAIDADVVLLFRVE